MGKTINTADVDSLEQNASFEQDSGDLPPTDIVAYNELRSCADILRMYQTGQLEIQPDFQRDVVWVNPAQTRFIDSLTKQLPIPSMCFSLDYKTEKRVVIDGLQRITSVVKFLSNPDWKLSDLNDIDDRLSGKTVGTVMASNREIYERVQNLTIPITVLRCDSSKKSHTEYLFTVFHRLNTGGNKLNNQEIRNCIYNGKYNTLLKELASSKRWKRLLKLNDKTIYRFSNEEIILRFFAFYDNLNNYNGKLAQFLNSYMHDNREPIEDFLSNKKNLFENTVDFIQGNLLENKPIGKVSKAKLEGLLIGVAINLDKLKSTSTEGAKTLYDNFQNLPEYQLENLKSDLSSKEKVVTRIKSAIGVFSD